MLLKKLRELSEKKIEGIRLEKKEWLPFYKLLVHFSFGRIMKIDYSTISS